MWFFKYALINGQSDWTMPEETSDDIDTVRQQHAWSLSQLFLFGPFESRDTALSALDNLLATLIHLPIATSERSNGDLACASLSRTPSAADSA